jgi:flagellar hook assembly protein FlgD
MTFTNLPPECSIRIYTIAGDLVREIQHSNLRGPQGQESWDVKTTHGDPVASGVYLWRVQSSIDAKNGKLMVIR